MPTKAHVLYACWLFVLAMLVAVQVQDAEDAVKEEVESSGAAAVIERYAPSLASSAPQNASLKMSAPQNVVVSSTSRAAVASAVSSTPRVAPAVAGLPRVPKVHNCKDIEDKTLCKLNYVPRLGEATRRNPIKLWAAIAAYDLSSRIFVERMIRNFASFGAYNVQVTVQVHTTVNPEKWSSREVQRLSKINMLDIEWKLHNPDIRFNLVRTYRPELVKVLALFDLFFFSEDDTDFTWDHFELMLRTWEPLEYSQYMPGLLRYSLGDCPGKHFCCDYIRSLKGSGPSYRRFNWPHREGNMCVTAGVEDHHCIHSNYSYLQQIPAKHKFLIDQSMSSMYAAPIANKLVVIDGQSWWQPDRSYQAFFLLPKELMAYMALNKSVTFSSRPNEQEEWVSTHGVRKGMISGSRDYFSSGWLFPVNQGKECGVAATCNKEGAGRPNSRLWSYTEGPFRKLIPVINTEAYGVHHLSDKYYQLEHQGAYPTCAVRREAGSMLLHLEELQTILRKMNADGRKDCFPLWLALANLTACKSDAEGGDSSAYAAQVLSCDAMFHACINRCRVYDTKCHKRCFVRFSGKLQPCSARLAT